MSKFNFEQEARIQRQKINYFNYKVGNNDFDKAIDYLIIAEWDEKKAVEAYLTFNRKKNNPQKIIPSIKKTNYNNNNINSNQKKNLPPISNKNQKPQQNLQNLQNPQTTNNNITEINITDELLKNNTPYKTKDFNNYTTIVKHIQNKFLFVEKSLEGFLKTLKEHPGVIILLNYRKIDEFIKHANKINNNNIVPDSFIPYYV